LFQYWHLEGKGNTYPFSQFIRGVQASCRALSNIKKIIKRRRRTGRGMRRIVKEL